MSNIKRVVTKLHALHLSSGVIAELVRRDRSYVRRLLVQLGCAENWGNVADVRASLPSELLEECAQLAAATKS